VPLDFVSGHVYGGDNPLHVFGASNAGAVSQDDMVCDATQKMKREIALSANPNLPLFVTEFNAAFEDQHSYDSLYMGPFLAHTIRACGGLATMMSYWTFSDVFEEKGPVRRPSMEDLASSPPEVSSSLPTLHLNCSTSLAPSASSRMILIRS